MSEIDILKQQLRGMDSGSIIFEYSIPRMGKRADVILIFSDIVFVIEFKVGEKQYLQSDIVQCQYFLDVLLQTRHGTTATFRDRLQTSRPHRQCVIIVPAKVHRGTIDFGLELFQKHYRNKAIADEDIFYYTYAIFSDPKY